MFHTNGANRAWNSGGASYSHVGNGRHNRNDAIDFRGADDISIAVGGRTVTADIASRSTRKVVKALADHGADNVVVVVQGVLAENNRVESHDRR